MTRIDTEKPQEVLYLFSSNIRPLYEQDILDVLAAPEGATYQFRYDRAYVDSRTLEQWEHLKDRSVLVNFSLQQPAKYFQPVFFPVRKGRVIRTYVLGSVCVIEFLVGRYVTLPDPQDDRASRALAYTDQLEAESVPRPYPFSAGLGKDVSDTGVLDQTSDDHVLFSRAAHYLVGTESFSQAVFLRHLKLQSMDGTEVRPDAEGRFVLRGGLSYELLLTHHQPGDVRGATKFDVTVDDGILRLIERAEFEIASRYDVILVPFHAVADEHNEDRDTLLVVAPETGARGPTLRLRIKVRPQAATIAANMGGVTFGLLLLGLPTVFTEWSGLIRGAFFVAGAVISGLAATFGVGGLKRAISA